MAGVSGEIVTIPGVPSDECPAMIYEPIATLPASIDIEIESMPAGIVRGTLLNSDGTPAEGAGMMVYDWLSLTRAQKPIGAFALPGVPVDTPCEIGISGKSPAILFHELPEGTSGQGTDIGELSLPPYPKDALLNVTLAIETGARDGKGYPLDRDVTLIRVQSAAMFGYLLTNEADGRRLKCDWRFMSEDRTRVWVPAGQYFVCPGSMLSHYPRRVRELTLNNQRGLLDAASAMKITIEPGENLVFEADAIEIMQAIDSIPVE